MEGRNVMNSVEEGCDCDKKLRCGLKTEMSGGSPTHRTSVFGLSVTSGYSKLVLGLNALIVAEGWPSWLWVLQVAQWNNIVVIT